MSLARRLPGAGRRGRRRGRRAPARPARRCGCSAWTRSRSRPCWRGWRPASTNAPAAPPQGRGPAVRRCPPTGPRPGPARRLPSHRGGASVCVLKRGTVTAAAPTTTARTFMVRSISRPLRPAGGAGAPDRHRRSGRLRQDRADRRACKAMRTSWRSRRSPTTSTPRRTRDFLSRRARCRPNGSWGSRPAAARTPPSARTRRSTSPRSSDMRRRFPGLDMILIESGGDNLAATFSPELADLTIYVIDVSGGDKIPRKGGPGDHAVRSARHQQDRPRPLVGANLEVMARDAAAVRGQRPTVFTSLVADPEATEVAAWVRTVRSAVATARPPRWPRDRPDDRGRRGWRRAGRGGLRAAADAAAGARRRARGPVRAAPGRDRGRPAGRRRPVGLAAIRPGARATLRATGASVAQGRRRGRGGAVDPRRPGRRSQPGRRPRSAGRLPGAAGWTSASSWRSAPAPRSSGAS